MQRLTLKSLFRGFVARIGGRRSSGVAATGIAVNSGGIAAPTTVEYALQSTALWSCLRLISQSIACLPGHVFEETPTGKVKATTHSLYRALSKQPNPVMTFTQMVQTTVLQLLIWGNAFWIPQTVDSETVGLWPVDPALVRLMFNTDGSYFYRVMERGKPPREFSPLEILHFRIFSADGIIGLSPLDYHRATVESELFAQAYATSLFANGGRPSGVLEYQGVLKKDQIDNIRSSWAQLHSGPGGAGKIAVLEGGTKYQAISVPLEALQYVSQQGLTLGQIARIYGVPPHMVGASENPTYASVEQAGIEFSTYTQQPIVISIEQTVETALLRPPFIFRLNMSAFQRADIASRYRAYAMGRQWGWFSVNDIRELEEMNKIGPEGDVYLTPLNMAPATADPTADAETEANATALAKQMKGRMR